MKVDFFLQSLIMKLLSLYRNGKKYCENCNEIMDAGKTSSTHCLLNETVPLSHTCTGIFYVSACEGIGTADHFALLVVM